MGIKKNPSKFSIESFSKSLEEQKSKKDKEETEQKLPRTPFEESEIQAFWKDYLETIKRKDPFLFNAIRDFKIEKIDEDTLSVHYTSESAKSEFDKICPLFFSELKHKINNFYIEPQYKMIETNVRKERTTKRSIFEQMSEKNPLLLELNNIFKFDLND